MTEQKIVCGDGVRWLSEQPDESIDLIIADPPYNVGKDYGNYLDEKDKLEYQRFCDEWISQAVRVLKPHGTIYCFMGFKFISHIFSLLDEKYNLLFNSWICWHYTQGLGRRRGFSARHDDILMFNKTKEFVFNLDDIRVPQKYYRSINNMRGANPGDVWAFSHIHYCQENRQKHPTQKPEGLIERMVLASSNPGDYVVDPFAGSGTTLRVCQQLGRNCTGVEINEEYVDMTRQRLGAPFWGFDSIDERMNRVPLDLRKAEVRDVYIENHIRWFLRNHENDLENFFREVEKIYGKEATRKFRTKTGRSSVQASFSFE